MPSSICISVTPVSRSPRMIAHWIGAAPRYFGKQRRVHVEAAVRAASPAPRAAGSCRRRRRRTTSGASARSSSTNGGLRTDVGCSTGTPAASARSLTAGGVQAEPAPRRLVRLRDHGDAPPRSASSASRHGTANSGEPMKTTRSLSMRGNLPEIGAVKMRAIGRAHLVVGQSTRCASSRTSPNLVERVAELVDAAARRSARARTRA